MAELADAQDSDSCPNIGGAGSSPVIRSQKAVVFYNTTAFIIYSTKKKAQTAICAKNCKPPHSDKAKIKEFDFPAS